VTVVNTIFNNVSVISWWSVLLVEETGLPRKKHWLTTSHWQSLSHKVVSSTHWDANSRCPSPHTHTHYSRTAI